MTIQEHRAALAADGRDLCGRCYEQATTPGTWLCRLCKAAVARLDASYMERMAKAIGASLGKGGSSASMATEHGESSARGALF